jgi:putative ABC transport system ATP-binding protein
MQVFHDINQEGTTVLLVTHDVKIAAQSERILYMLDGNIEGEYIMTKFNYLEDDLKERESRLTKWLLNMGF